MSEMSSGCILFVDDEDGVRALAARVLRKAGYHVIDLADGAEAVEYYRAHAEEISLVILDMMMPSMGGLEVLGRLREIRGDVRAVAVSGFLGHGISPRDVDEGGFQAFLAKPFALGELLQVLAELAPR